MLLNKGISIGFFIDKIKVDIIALSLYGFAIGILDTFSFMKSISIPLGITSIVGTAVSLLLAFRTAQSYDRWWEARGIWGAIVNDSRTLVRQIKTFYKAVDERDQFIYNIAQRQIIWVHTLTHSLRRQPLSNNINNYLASRSIRQKNIPNAILSLHADDIKKAYKQRRISEFQQIQLDNTLG